MDFSTLNWLAVLVAAVSSFVIGFIWYNPKVLGTAWMKAAGLTDEDLQNSNPAKTFGLSFIWTLVMAFNLATFLNDPSIGMNEGMMYGFFTGFGWIAMAFFVMGLYEQKSTGWMLIHGGYWVVCLTVMGLILGAWK